MISAPPSLTAKVDAYFTGRTWLLPKLLKWWDESDERIFLLKGEPGTGKSMILTWLAGAGPLPLDSVSREQLVDLRAAVRATHFCQAATGSNAPEAFAENIARQLSGSVPGFADAISAVLSDRIHIVGTAEAGTAASGSTVAGVAIGQINLLMASDELSFDRKLISPLKKLYESGFAGPLLILIDALDEALTYSGVTIVDLISRLKDLPSPIRILATTRKEPRVLKYFQNGETFDLVCDAPHEANDVRDYASQRLKILNSVGDDKRSEFASRLANHAKGIFLYASMVLDELLQISPSHFPELDTYPLPEGLSGIYIDFLNRELSRNEIQWFGVYEPLLGLIAVARGEGLTARQLSNIAGTDVRAALRNVKQYLRGELPNGPFRTFHESFTDFLLDERRNLHFHIDAERWNRKIVDYYCETCGGEWKRGDIYGESHLLRHAIFGNAIDRLDELLTNVDFIVSAEPNSVVEALPYAKCDKARDMAWIYGHNVHLFRDSSRGERLSYFELSASQNRLPNLLWPIPDRVQTKHWSTAWTDCKPAPRYFALQGHHADITSTASGTQNGRLCLASGDSCGEVKIWDLQSGHFLRSLPDRRPFRINVLKWYSLGELPLLLVGDNEGMLECWDLRQVVRLWGSNDYHWTVKGISFAASEGKIWTVSCSAGSPGALLAIDLLTGETGRMFRLGPSFSRGALRGLYSVACYNRLGETFVLSGDQDGVIREWNFRTGIVTKEIKVYDHEVRYLEVFKGSCGLLLASASLSRHIKVHDIDTLSTLKHIEEHVEAGFLPVVAVGEMDETPVLYSADDRYIRVFSASTGLEIGRINGIHSDWIATILRCKDETRNLIVFGGAAQLIYVIDQANISKSFLEYPQSDIRTFTAIETIDLFDRQYFACGSEEGKLTFRDVDFGRQDGTLEIQLPGAIRSIKSLRWADHVFLACTLSKGVWLWSMQGQPWLDSKEVWAVALGVANGQPAMAIGTSSGELITYLLLPEVTMIKSIQAHSCTSADLNDHKVYPCAISDISFIEVDGSLVLVTVGAEDKTIKLWEWKTLTLINAIPKAHRSYITRLLSGGTGSEGLLISVGMDRRCKIWSASMGTCCAEFMDPRLGQQHAEAWNENLWYVDAVTGWVSGRQLIVVGARDGMITVIDRADMRVLATVSIGYGMWGRSLALSSTGTILASGLRGLTAIKVCP